MMHQTWLRWLYELPQVVRPWVNNTNWGIASTVNEELVPKIEIHWLFLVWLKSTEIVKIYCKIHHSFQSGQYKILRLIKWHVEVRGNPNYTEHDCKYQVFTQNQRVNVFQLVKPSLYFSQVSSIILFWLFFPSLQCYIYFFVHEKDLDI